MKILVVYAHPVETSFVAGVHEAAVRRLRAGGHAVDDCDLYAEGFDPVLSRQDRLEYHNVSVNRTRVADYVDRLKAAEALVFVHPVWNFGLPAMLKGFLDRVFLPGVSFELGPDGGLTLTLRHITHFADVCTYGADRWRAVLAGDPPRRFMGRTMRAHMALRARYDYLACYDMNHTTPDRRARFLARVDRTFARW